MNETPRGKQRGIKIPAAQDKSRSKLRGTNPEEIRIRVTIVFTIIMAICFSGIFFSSCKKKYMDGMIIFTRVAGKMMDINALTGDSLRYIPQTSIVALDPDKPAGSLKVLTEGYFSARSPEISYDGKYLLFAAQQKQNDKWQIWEMN